MKNSNNLMVGLVGYAITLVSLFAILLTVPVGMADATVNQARQETPQIESVQEVATEQAAL